MSIKRYSLESSALWLSDDDCPGCDMELDADGTYVEWEDFEKLRVLLKKVIAVAEDLCVDSPTPEGMSLLQQAVDMVKEYESA